MDFIEMLNRSINRFFTQNCTPIQKNMLLLGIRKEIKSVIIIYDSKNKGNGKEFERYTYREEPADVICR